MKSKRITFTFEQLTELTENLPLLTNTLHVLKYNDVSVATAILISRDRIMSERQMKLDLGNPYLLERINIETGIIEPPVLIANPKQQKYVPEDVSHK